MIKFEFLAESKGPCEPGFNWMVQCIVAVPVVPHLSEEEHYHLEPSGLLILRQRGFQVEASTRFLLLFGRTPVCVVTALKAFLLPSLQPLLPLPPSTPPLFFSPL